VNATTRVLARAGSHVWAIARLGLLATSLVAASAAGAQPAASTPSTTGARSLSLPSPPHGGGAWVRIPAAGPDELAYDEDKVVVAGAEVSYWRRVVFAQPQAFRGLPVRTALFREQVHCDDHTLRVLAHALLGADGTLIDQAIFAAPEASPVIPDTVGDALWRAMCPRVAQRRAAGERLRLLQERLDSRRRELEKLRAEVEGLETSLARQRPETGSPDRGPSDRGATDRDLPRPSGRQGP